MKNTQKKDLELIHVLLKEKNKLTAKVIVYLDKIQVIDTVLNAIYNRANTLK